MNPKDVDVPSAMTPVEKDAEAQPRFVFGNTVAKPPERREPEEGFSTETSCLRRSNLKRVPDRILGNGSLTYLSLEGNQISIIPDSVFLSLPKLQWLDLRNNIVTSLPAAIGSHRSLKTLLLEGNPISELPPELGNVITLRGLNLRDCPIRFPPQEVVHQGLPSILRFLRSALAERPVSAQKPFPVVEKLQLSEVTGSSEDMQDELAEEDEMQKFRELKDKFVLLDRAELGLVAHCDTKQKVRLPSVPKRKIVRSSMIPELPLYDPQPQKRPQEKKQASLEQKKTQEALQKWRTQAKATQERKASEHKQKRQDRQRKGEHKQHGAPPQGADPKPAPGTGSGASQRQGCGTATKEAEEHRSARELERLIRARVERMQERRRNPIGSMTQQMAAAEEDLREMRKLQERLLERKRNLWRQGGGSFSPFTANT
ncbi:unnamed protein product [Menidia menidia]|uniref:(Atlantic silverside) hypothetical protein n=1 Tax=Menidia menidia TaxID=238744 RepID=A0A8S4BRP1_9TELE|nr:unnamed protein product [Menidia menidia]